MTAFPPAPNAQQTGWLLEVLVRQGQVPDQPGWRAEVAPGGSTDRTFRVIDPVGVPRLSARLARPGLAEHLRHEQRTLLELVGETTLSVACSSPQDVVLIEDDTLAERMVLVHAHMPGQPHPLGGVTPDARERLGSCLAWVHGHQRESYMIWPSLESQFGTRADLYHDRLATLRRYQSVKWLADAGTLLDRLADATLRANAGWQERDFSLCHGDLSIGNLLWEGDALALIDWEFARDGDPAEDIAYLVSEQNLPPDQVAELAEGYVGADGDPWAFARLPAWLPLVALDAALWWADYHLAHGADPARLPDVIARLDRARTFLPFT
jgi:Ser/Thr protein kinase RdoA (MazF antagonist)